MEKISSDDICEVKGDTADEQHTRYAANDRK